MQYSIITAVCLLCFIPGLLEWNLILLIMPHKTNKLKVLILDFFVYISNLTCHFTSSKLPVHSFIRTLISICLYFILHLSSILPPPPDILRKKKHLISPYTPTLPQHSQHRHSIKIPPAVEPWCPIRPPTCLLQTPWDKGMDEGGGLMNKWLRLTVSGGLDSVFYDFWPQIFLICQTTLAVPVIPTSGPRSTISAGEWCIVLFSRFNTGFLFTFSLVNIRLTVWAIH